MSLTGAGNWWDKKDKYSQCPNCDKKGFYSTSLVDKKGQIWKWDACMFCKKTELKFDQATTFIQTIILGEIMNEYKSLTGCNAYRFAPEEERPEFCDCHNCISKQLDFMEAIQMEIALEVKHGQFWISLCIM